MRYSVELVLRSEGALNTSTRIIYANFEKFEAAQKFRNIIDEIIKKGWNERCHAMSPAPDPPTPE